MIPFDWQGKREEPSQGSNLGPLNDRFFQELDEQIRNIQEQIKKISEEFGISPKEWDEYSRHSPDLPVNLRQLLEKQRELLDFKKEKHPTPMAFTKKKK